MTISNLTCFLRLSLVDQMQLLLRTNPPNAVYNVSFACQKNEEEGIHVAVSPNTRHLSFSLSPV